MNTKNSKRFGGGSVAFLTYFLFTSRVFATILYPQQRTRPLSTREFFGIIDDFIDFLWVLLVALGVIFFLLAGYKYLMSGGDSEKVREAHRMIIYGLVAMAIGFISRGLVFLVASIFA